MMKATGLKEVILMLSLFVAGSISPSNGVDDGFAALAPLTIIQLAGMVILVGVVHTLITRYFLLNKTKTNP